MYETIMDILGKNGPSSIEEICHEMNQSLINKQVSPSNIKLSLSRKKELFSIENDVVMIQPDKDFVTLALDIGVFPNIRYHVNVHFQRGVFNVVEWRDQQQDQNREPQVKHIGSIEEFKKALYKLKVWNWEKHDTVPQLDQYVGMIGYFKLTTKATVYENIGYEPLSTEWKSFQRAIENLTGLSL